jgi:hypothetical protein
MERLGERLADRSVKWRIWTPPSRPILIAPRAPDGAEHISSDGPGTNIFKLAGSTLIINAARYAAFFPMHLAKGSPCR